MHLLRRVLTNYARFFQSLFMRRRKAKRDGNPFIYPLF